RRRGRLAVVLLPGQLPRVRGKQAGAAGRGGGAAAPPAIQVAQVEKGVRSLFRGGWSRIRVGKRDLTPFSFSARGSGLFPGRCAARARASRPRLPDRTRARARGRPGGSRAAARTRA